MAQQRNTAGFLRKNLKGILITVVFATSFFIPTPYYLYQPGSAEELAPKVTVANSAKDEKGNLMLTTVLSIKASNIYVLGYGLLAPHTEIRAEEDVKGDLSTDEYDRLLKHMMTSSQQFAIINAFKAAKESVQVTYNGVFVRDMYPQSKAKGVLEVGDLITSVDGKAMQRAEQLTDYISKSKKPGDKVKVDFTRDGANKTAEIELINLTSLSDKPNDPPRAGFGMLPENDVTSQPAREVTIHAEDIGGPSAGLMFSMEIYSQLTPGDLTKGYKIAGTGTMDLDGKVGQIGGIRHKIVAADKAGAEIFFAPADVNPHDTNAAEAADEAKKIGAKMKVIPVATMQEAVDYLTKLQPKQ
ncbi:MAG: SepM family pheromone-processing serine protease [Tumebacillaceae bacterium]